jgi:hypothetical protein
MSARYKCRACSVERVESNIVQLHAHAGPWFDHWRRRGAASYGAVLLDDL